MDKDEETGCLQLGGRKIGATAVSIPRILFLYQCPQIPVCERRQSFEHLCTLISVHSARELTVSSLFDVLTPRPEYYRQCLEILNRIVLGRYVSQ